MFGQKIENAAPTIFSLAHLSPNTGKKLVSPLSTIMNTVKMNKFGESE